MGKLEIPAILLGGTAITALGVIRNLGRNGVDVYYVADGNDEAAFSRYVKRFYVIPKIQDDPGILKAFLEKFRTEVSSSAVVFPGSDLFCLSLSAMGNGLGDDFHVLLPGQRVIQELVNKKTFYRSLEAANLPHPTTWYPERPTDIDEIGAEVEYPVYVKPCLSQIFSRRFGRKGFVANSREELTKYSSMAMRSQIDIVVQEIIPGPTRDVVSINGYFDRSSDPRGLFAYRGLRRWPNDFGTCSLAESIPLSSISQAKQITVDYLHALAYHGLVDADFKRDSRDGIFKFLEVNIRSWWQNAFPTKCGINLVFMAYLDALGFSVASQESYETGVNWIYFLDDVRAVRAMISNGKMTFRDWLSSLRSTKDWAYFAHDDVLPWLVSNLFSVRKLAERVIAASSSY